MRRRSRRSRPPHAPLHDLQHAQRGSFARYSAGDRGVPGETISRFWTREAAGLSPQSTVARRARWTRTTLWIRGRGVRYQRKVVGVSAQTRTKLEQTCRNLWGKNARVFSGNWSFGGKSPPNSLYLFLQNRRHAPGRIKSTIETALKEIPTRLSSPLDHAPPFHSIASLDHGSSLA